LPLQAATSIVPSSNLFTSVLKVISVAPFLFNRFRSCLGSLSMRRHQAQTDRGRSAPAIDFYFWINRLLEASDLPMFLTWRRGVTPPRTDFTREDVDLLRLFADRLSASFVPRSHLFRSRSTPPAILLFSTGISGCLLGRLPKSLSGGTRRICLD
jgi:hypothetical protein